MRALFLLLPIAFLALIVWLVIEHSATQVAAVVDPSGPGFLRGMLHGFLFPFSFIGSLISDKIAIYAVPNNGGWYDFGYFLGIVVFGVGARKTHTVTRDRVVHVPIKNVTERE